MSTFKYILLMITAVVAINVAAGTEQTLTFVKTNGSRIVFSANGLVITYDDWAHALVTNDETSATLQVVELDYMYFGDDDEPVSSITGDVDQDGMVNIADVNAVIACILDGTYKDKADVNSDGLINITDLNIIINIILHS